MKRFNAFIKKKKSLHKTLKHNDISGGFCVESFVWFAKDPLEICPIKSYLVNGGFASAQTGSMFSQFITAV